MYTKLNKYLNAYTGSILLEDSYKDSPFTMDSYICEDIADLSRMRFFIRKMLIISQKIDLEEFDEFEFEKELDGFYYYKRVRSNLVSVYWVWNANMNLIYISTYVKCVKYGLYEKDLQNAKYEILLYPSEVRDSSKINIQATGEHKWIDESKFQYNLGFGTNSSKHEICYPYFCQVMDLYPKYEKLFEPTSNNIIKNEFCCFATSNGSCTIRNYFFTYLCQNYKLVKSYGALMNNVGRRIAHCWGSQEQLDLLGSHKFVLCFENSRDDTDYYITEKILNAKLSGSIPIYWGTKKCLELFESDAYLYLEETSDNGFKKLLNEIKDLDQNDEKYLEMRNKRLINPDKIKHLRNFSIRNQIY
jgi:hypothetical protein